MLEPEGSRSVAERGDPVKRAGEDVLTASTPEPRTEGGGCPFNFRPQLFHLHKDHELFEEGDVHRHLYLQDLYTSEESDTPTLSVSEFACHISGCSAVHSTLEEYEHHYNSLHRHVCCSCRRSLPSARLLDIHIQEWHDSLFAILAQRQDMYKCLVEGCEHKFRTSTNRKEHLIRIHKYPPDFRFDKTRKGTREAKQQHQNDAMEGIDVCESEGVHEVVCDLVPKQSETEEESMEMQLCDNSMVKTTSSEEDAHLSATVHVTSAGAEPPNPRYSYRVPTTVCFGHGSVRGFRGRKGRRK